MSILKPLETPEVIFTDEGSRKMTHEVFCYSITPLSNPPVTVDVFKGWINKKGLFQTLETSKRSNAITADEFKELLEGNPSGKPAGDFRLSDILRVLGKRGKAAT